MGYLKSSIGILVFTLFTFEMIGQTFTPEPRNSSGKVEFTISDLPLQIANYDKYNNSPYYQSFVIYGDGNYLRYGTLANPVINGYNFEYDYRNLNAEYPGCALLISRKDEDDPPPPNEALVLPNTQRKFIHPNGNQNASEPIYSNVNTGSTLDHIPLITTNNDWVKMGFSHYHESESGEIYFMQEDNIHAVPIAYKPEGKGILLFFYNAPQNFENYTGINIYNEQIGTFLPNYYEPNDLTIEHVIAKSLAIKNLVVDEPDFLITDENRIPLTNPIDISNSTYRNGWLAHSIDSEESDLLNNSTTGVVQPIGSSLSKGELRLFHFIKSPNPFPLLEEDASFLAVLYDSRATPNNVDLSSLNALNNGVFPDSFRSFNFADFAILHAKKGEPDDPGGLFVTNICQCCDDQYIVSFELEFCNSTSATINAKEATIFLKGTLNNESKPYLMRYSLQSQCVEPEAGTTIGRCENIRACPPSGINSSLSPADIVQCYQFDTGIAPGKCGSIRFSAKMNSYNLNKLLEEPVLEYCVNFGQNIDVGEYCSKNAILLDSLYQFNELTNEFQYLPNPIWENRNQICSPMLSNYYDCGNCE